MQEGTLDLQWFFAVGPGAEVSVNRFKIRFALFFFRETVSKDGVCIKPGVGDVESFREHAEGHGSRIVGASRQVHLTRDAERPSVDHSGEVLHGYVGFVETD